MAALLCAQATMDAHRGVATVAEQGLRFLDNLSDADANLVSGACLGPPLFTSLRSRMRICCTHPV